MSNPRSPIVSRTGFTRTGIEFECPISKSKWCEIRDRLVDGPPNALRGWGAKQY